MTLLLRLRSSATGIKRFPGAFVVETAALGDDAKRAEYACSARYDLLTAPVISLEGARRVSLPGLFATLARGDVGSLPRLRPHQRPAWHMFAVQLAALALRSDEGPLPTDEDPWRARLLALTGGDAGPWALIGPADRPAFLQPAEVPGLGWHEVPTPDALDMLITAKNHDLKQAVADGAGAEDWLFALVSLQTMEGFGGKANYGIARMNGGSSSRAMLGLAPATATGLDLAAWWRRDVEALLALPPVAMGTPGGPSLLWALPWAEGAQLHLADLDPLFIEVCRRVRLELRDGRITARRSGSAKARIDGAGTKGSVGDPWAPVHLAEGKALTLSTGRFDYEKLCELLWGKDDKRVWQVPALAQHQPGDDATMLLVAEALARGNSRTDGFMSRVVPVPGSQTGWTDEAGDLARQQMEEIRRVDRALRDGLALLAARGDREALGKPHYALTAPARARFEEYADSVFFPALWARLAALPERREAEVRADFIRDLHRAAKAIFAESMPAIPCPSALRPRAEVMAGMAFRSTLRAWTDARHILFPPKEAADDAEPAG